MADSAIEKKDEEVVTAPAKELEKEPTTEAKAAPAAEDVQAKENGANVVSAVAGTEAEADGDGLTKLERSIIHQVEYYFGDSNLQRDKFLLGEIAKDDEGWVPFTTLLTFKRLASLSTDIAAIVDALMKSDEGLLEISEDHTKVRRHPERAIPEHTDERRKEIMTRTAYVKGFPLDTSMADIVDFFVQSDKVLHVTMRKYLDKASKTYKFKGSVFVTFEKVEQAKDFIEKEKVLFGERILVRKWQEKYLQEKQEEHKSKANKKKEKKDKNKPAEEKIQLPTGAVLFFEGVNEDITREILRESVEKVDQELEIAFVDFSKGAKEGYFRLQGENTALEFLKKLTDNKLKLKDDVEIPLRVLSGDEEKAYLEKAVEQMRNRRNNFNKHHKKGGHHHGHGGFNRKRRGGNDSETQEKRKRNE